MFLARQCKRFIFALFKIRLDLGLARLQIMHAISSKRFALNRHKKSGGFHRRFLPQRN